MGNAFVLVLSPFSSTGFMREGTHQQEANMAHDSRLQLEEWRPSGLESTGEPFLPDRCLPWAMYSCSPFRRGHWPLDQR